MKARLLLIALAAIGLVGLARAESVAVDFQLDPITGLSTDGGSPAGTVGHWITPNTFYGSSTAIHYGADQSTSYRENSFGSQRLAAGAVGDQPFGNFSRGVEPVAAGSPSAHITLEPEHLRAESSRQQNADLAETYLDWQRAFTLDPNSSITLSGLMSFESSLPLAPTARYSTWADSLDRVANRATLSFSDRSNASWGNGISLIANILNQDPRDWQSPFLGRTAGPDDFAYSTDPQGHLSLTVFNRSNVSMFGSFEILFVSSVADVPGIPEPSTWLAMLVGLAVLTWRHKPALRKPRLRSMVRGFTAR